MSDITARHIAAFALLLVALAVAVVLVIRTRQARERRRARPKRYHVRSAGQPDASTPDRD